MKLLLLLLLLISNPINANIISSSTVYFDANSNGNIITGQGNNSNTLSNAFLISDQGGFNSTFRGITNSGTTNTFFSVVSDTPLFSATINTPMMISATLLDITSGQIIPLMLDPITKTYIYDNLKYLDVYDFRVSYNTSNSSVIYTSITVAAIPEPEEYFMLLVGLFLVMIRLKSLHNKKDCV